MATEMTTHKFGLLPTTGPGRLAVGLVILFGVLFGVLALVMASQPKNGLMLTTNPPLAWTMLTVLGLAAVSASAGAVISAIALIRFGERSILAFIALAVGIVVMLFVAGEFIEGGHRIRLDGPAEVMGIKDPPAN